jgi:ankyrin repeat protein
MPLGGAAASDRGLRPRRSASTSSRLPCCARPAGPSQGAQGVRTPLCAWRGVPPWAPRLTAPSALPGAQGRLPRPVLRPPVHELALTLGVFRSRQRVHEGIAPPASAEGSRGRLLGLGRFPAKGSTHRRPGPKKVTMPLPAQCSICFSLSHRRPACPDAMLSEIESELEPDDPAITAREHLARSLLAACKVGNVTQADELVAAGASVNAADKRDLLDSALHRAAYWGHAGLVTRLLHHGADIALRNRLDYTALHWAAVRGKSDVLRALLAAAADVHAVDVEGNTALHFAAREGFPDIVGELIEAGARVNSVTTVWKYTPVIYAAMGGELGCLLQLAAHGADLKIKCAKGLDALGWATALERVECAEILSRLLGMEAAPTFLNLTDRTPELRELEAIGLLNIGPPHDVSSLLLFLTSL